MSWKKFAWLLLGMPLLARASCDAGSTPPTMNGPGGSLTQTFPGPSSTPPNYMTVTIINSYGAALSTSNALGTDSVSGALPAPVTGGSGTGTIAVSATVSFIAPTGWAGNIAIVDANHTISGDTSLVEGSFSMNGTNGTGVAVPDIDVSYVNGFTVPITCSCGGLIVSGCNLPLWSLAPCPQPNFEEGACVNPRRAASNATAADPFFLPCQGAAWTFVNDGAANSYGCESGDFTCCVGQSCPPNPKHQPSRR